MSIYYVSIGNSDDKLTQREWAMFVEDMDNLLEVNEFTIHGRWFSAPDRGFQNACWCFEETGSIQVGAWFRDGLAQFARRYRQDSIALAMAQTEFIGDGTP